MASRSAELAAAALEEYAAGRYDSANDKLSDLSAEMPTEDLKLKHNRVLALHAAGGCTGSSALLARLSDLASQHGVGVVDMCKSGATAGAAASGGAAGSPSDQDGALLGTPGLALVAYNLAVTAFQLRQYATALEYLKLIFRRIEPVDERVATCVCFLILELHVRAAYATPPTAESAALLTKVQAHLQTMLSALEARDINTEEFRCRLSVVKVKLAMLADDTKAAKAEMRTANDLMQNLMLSQGSGGGGGGGGGADAGGGTAVAADWWTLSGRTRTVTPNFVKAQLEFSRANYRKALKMLASCLRGGVERALYLNALGCVNFRLKRFTSASLYFARAVTANVEALGGAAPSGDDAAASSALPPHRRRPPASHMAELQYNCGVALLAAGRPAHALRCFKRATPGLARQPQLWMRYADGFIALGEQERAKASGSGVDDGAASDILLRLVGSGARQRAVLRRSGEQWGAVRAQSGKKKTALDAPANLTWPNASSGASTGAAETCLEHASRCLHNVIFLLSAVLDDSAGGGSGGGSAASASSGRGARSGGASSRKGAASQKAALAAMYQSAQLKLAYVMLCLRNPVRALTAARAVLAMPAAEHSEQRLHLAHLYCAEALCRLNNASEAATELNPAQLRDRRSPITTAERAALFVNLANVNALQKDFARAKKFAEQALSLCPALPAAVRVLVYIELQKGNDVGALQILRKRHATTASGKQTRGR